MADAASGQATPLWKKLGIKSGMRVALLDAPDGIEDVLYPMPDGVERDDRWPGPGTTDLVVSFVTEQDRLACVLPSLTDALAPDGVVWIAWPKRASRVRTDVTEHTVRDVALPIGWVDTKVCAVDDTWTALKLVLRKERRSKR